MTDIPSASLLNFFIFLLVPFACGFIARKLKFSPLIGYIIGGLVIGNVVGSRISKEAIDQFAFFGIIFLLFTVGLEVNFSQLVHLKKYIIIGGTLQALFTAALVYVLTLFFGFSILASILVALAFISSSTILIAKMLQDRGEEATFLGEIAIGILMFQDLLFIPLLIIFHSFSGQNVPLTTIMGDIVIGILKAAIIITIMYYVGKRIIPKIFDRIARTSRELLNVFIVLFIFFITYVSSLVGIPILIGVFMAGILVGQTREHHHVFSQIRPIRDILAVVFFVFIGSNINIPLIIPMLPKIILFAILVSIIKIGVLLFVLLQLNFHSRNAFNLSLLLFQVSENAFILAYTSFKQGALRYEEYLFISTSVLLTLLFTPIITQGREKIYIWGRQMIRVYLPQLESYINRHIDTDLSPIDALQLKNHVVICGYGRVGKQIGKALLQAEIPFIAIDFNFHEVEKSKNEGINIIYGDPTDIDILDYAEVENALIVVTAVADHYSQEAIVLNTQKLNPKAILISRVHKREDGQRLKDLGVQVVVQPEFEASLSIIKRLLHAFNRTNDDIVTHIKRIKMEQGMY